MWAGLSCTQTVPLLTQYVVHYDLCKLNDRDKWDKIHPRDAQSLMVNLQLHCLCQLSDYMPPNFGGLSLKWDMVSMTIHSMAYGWKSCNLKKEGAKPKQTPWQADRSTQNSSLGFRLHFNFSFWSFETKSRPLIFSFSVFVQGFVYMINQIHIKQVWVEDTIILIKDI